MVKDKEWRFLLKPAEQQRMTASKQEVTSRATGLKGGDSEAKLGEELIHFKADTKIAASEINVNL